MPMWIAAFCHVIQKQSDSSFNVSLLAGQLCHYEDWISGSEHPDYMQKYVNVFVQTQGGRIHRDLM